MAGLIARGRALVRSALYAILGARGAHRLTHRRAPLPLTDDDRAVVDRYHVLAYEKGGLASTYWLGRPILKTPEDCWTYQEILHDVRPDLIIETGTYLGGSALFLASICDLLGHGRILTIDDKRRVSLRHPRVTALIGDSTSETILSRVRAEAANAKAVLVTLDADHRAESVLREMRAYAPFVTLGSYLVVEDTNVNGHPVWPDHGPGPTEALLAFMREDRRFEIDRSREKFLLTFFPSGWLKRV